LMTLEIGPRDEVIVPTFTFFATAGVVHRVGARPVFVDIDPDTFLMDVGQVADRLTPATRAVIPVHLYGLAMPLRPLFDAVSRHGVHVIEDAAQSIGAVCPDYPDRKSGAIGTFGALSFYPTKNLGAIGDAGALLTNDEKLLNRARQCRLHGETQKYHHEFVGGNFRIDVLQAAILSIKLRHLDDWTRRRRQVAANYTRLLVDAGVAPEFVRPPAVAGCDDLSQTNQHVFHQYVIRTSRRDDLMAHLQQCGIGAGIYYPVPLHLQECFSYLGHKPGDLPHAEKAAAEVLALPMYPELTDQQQQRIVEEIARFHKRR
ncbi:MAG: DegT/DnrJ/EryC1/StrS family aminotransferase, partial [Planctomycetota bacterium]